MRLCIHWRHRHITDERLAAVRAVLEQHPGPHEVRVVVAGTPGTVRLPVAVDAEASGLCRDLHFAMDTSGMAHALRDDGPF